MINTGSISPWNTRGRVIIRADVDFWFDNVINAGYYKDATSVLRDDVENATENIFSLIIDHLSSDWLQLWLFCRRNLKTHGTVTVRNPRGGFPHQSRCVDAAQSENCFCFCTVIQEESTGNRLRNTNRCGSADQLMNANCAKKGLKVKKKKRSAACVNVAGLMWTLTASVQQG